MAKWSILYWIEMYGSQVLGKNIAVTDSLFHDKDLSITNNSIEENKLLSDTNTEDYQQSSNITSGIIIEKMTEIERIPQSIININMESFKKLGISNFTCVFRKGYADEYQICLDISGQYEGRVQKSIVFMIMCFNDRHRF